MWEMGIGFKSGFHKILEVLNDPIENERKRVASNDYTTQK